MPGGAPQSFLWPAILLAVTYTLIASERVNRAIVALLAGSIAIASGMIEQEDAVRAIDFNTLALLAGTMIIVAIARKSGVFGYAAILAVQMTKGSPAGSLVTLSLVTGVKIGRAHV